MMCFLVGLSLGAIFGFLGAALCAAAHEGD